MSAAHTLVPTKKQDLTVPIELLLVEDDDLDARRIQRLIAEAGAMNVTIHRCRSLAELPAQLQLCSPDLALVDLTLPDASGTEMVEAIMDRLPELPIIVQTSSSDESLPLEALSLGAEDYLSKATMSSEILERAIRYSMTRRNARRVLVATEAQLAEVDADLEDITHVVAHDIRAPVRTARMMAERLVAHTSTPDELTTDLGQRLEKALGCLDDLVVGMLDYADLRGTAMVQEPVVVADIADDVVAGLEADLTTHNGTVHLDIPERTTAMLRGDLLHRVLQNLIANSLRYTRPGIAPIVSVDAKVRRSRLLIDVTDNGIGIPPESWEQVFSLFERLSSNHERGLGLGLAVCRRIIGNHKGSIRVVPSPGQGTRIRIELPFVVPPVSIVNDEIEIIPES